MADSPFATFDSVSSLTFQDYLVGYRGIRETQINYTDFLKNTLQADLSSKQLISVYSTVKSLSDTWEESVYITPLQVASASWDSVYSTVKSLSDTWEESVYITPLQVASASWDSVYSTVKSLSDTWEESIYITPLQVASGSWDSVYSSVRTNSANWTNAYTNLINNSAAYLTGTDVNLGQIPTVSASWDSVYSNVRTNSAGWEATKSKMYASSASWDSVYSTVNSISSIIPNPATTISPQIAVGITALSSINFLNTLSPQLLYTVPAGKIFLVTDYSIIIDAVVGGSVSDSSLPTFRLYRHDTLTNAANQVTNSLTPVTASGNTFTTNRYYRIGGSVTALNGKALVSGDDASPQNKIWFRVESLGTNSYTGLSGRVVVTGNLL